MPMLAKDVRQPLLLLRLSVVVVMAVWVGNKFLNPDHTAAVFQNFYMIPWVTPEVSYGIGVIQGLIVLAFLVGFRKTWSYGLVLFIHAVATVASWRMYLDPYEGANILFFAAWPMLAALVTLYALRDQDTLLAFKR